MPTYTYTAINESGVRDRGQVVAASEHDAYRALAGNGLTPVRLKESQRRRVRVRTRGIATEDVAVLARELSILVEAKIPLARGLMSIAEHEESPRLRSVLLDLVGAIESGETLSSALSRYPDVFDDVFVGSMRAAEASGNLAAVSEHLAEMLERQIELNRQVRRALAYPLIVLCFVALAVGVIVIFVVPRFGEIFEQNGVQLPLITRVIKLAGDTIASNWWAFAGGGAALAAFLWRALRGAHGRVLIEQALLRIPHVGEMMIAITATRFTRVLSIALDSGLDLIESIEIAGRSSGRPVFARDTARMVDRLRSGATLGDVVDDTKYLPRFAQRLLAAGKDSRELAGAARVISKHYDRLSEHLAKTISTMVEPLITIALAGIVLLVALSVFLPMWKMVRVGG